MLRKMNWRNANIMKKRLTMMKNNREFKLICWLLGEILIAAWKMRTELIMEPDIRLVLSIVKLSSALVGIFPIVN